MGQDRRVSPTRRRPCCSAAWSTYRCREADLNGIRAIFGSVDLARDVRVSLVRASGPTSLTSAMRGVFEAIASPFGEVRLSPEQVFYMALAQRLFMTNIIMNFPLYYMPPFKYWCGGDGNNAKFPCSISWMIRKGAPRCSTFCTWLPGWVFLLYAAFLHEQSNALGIQALVLSMFVSGFITCIAFPIREDIPMGSHDTVHDIGAMVYVAHHLLLSEWFLGVDCLFGSNLHGLGFTVNTLVCAAVQHLRKNDNRLARHLYGRWFCGSPAQIRYDSYLYIIELVFAVTENCLFIFFVSGMSSGSAVGS
ncbi:unnamed protein product [Prorocentrum cordatum]|uniref:Uncharacterized protein n=1 Tax=Prorocentrum cordatum TaxID=2364126 RepID=A0ABN9X4M4_9DINO|nr:unnamed protein product [Polarella glacialis]